MSREFKAKNIWEEVDHSLIMDYGKRYMDFFSACFLIAFYGEKKHFYIFKFLKYMFVSYLMSLNLNNLSLYFIGQLVFIAMNLYGIYQIR